MKGKVAPTYIRIYVCMYNLYRGTITCSYICIKGSVRLYTYAELRLNGPMYLSNVKCAYPIKQCCLIQYRILIKLGIMVTVIP